MKKYNRFSKMLTLIVALTTIMFACVDDDYDTPPIDQIPVGNVYTIQQLKDFYNTVNSAYTLTDDASVYATVTMDNETDNSYRTFFIQDETGAIACYQDVSGGVYIGDSIRIYLKDLIIMKYSELFQINSISGAGMNVDANLIKQGTNNKRVPEDATIAEINSNKSYWQGRLVKISNVQFVETDTAETLATPETLTTENRLIQDSDDNQLIVRTSGYCTFAGAGVPDGSGSLIAIVGQYNNDMQLYIRRLSEIEMDGDRFDVSGGSGTGTGAGTFDNPYNVAHAISNNSGDDVWVEGYIVGVYETVSSPYVASFTAPFTTNSNMIIADSNSETDIANCLIIQLPAGDIRNPLNLVDNASNLGKQVKLLGDLTTYFSDEGLKNTSGYWMDGTGIIPESGFYEEDFSSDLGTYTAYSVNGTQEWGWDSYDNGCAKMSGYAGSNYANEDWLVSGQIDLSTRTNVTMVLREAINYITTYDDIQVLVSTDYDGTSDPSGQGTWTALTGFSRPAGSSWDFSASGDIDLSAYDGQSSFYIAFKYVSTTSGGATWEVGNVLLKEGAK